MFKSKVHLELLFANSGDNDEAAGQLFRLRLTEPTFYAGSDGDGNNQKPLVVDQRKQEILYNPEHDLFAHIVTLTNGTAYIKKLYAHKGDSTTFKNLKKSILLNLIPTNHHSNSLTSSYSSASDERQIPQIFSDDNSLAQPELFSPDSSSQVKIVAKLKKKSNSDLSSSTSSSSTSSNSIDSTFTGPTIFQTIEGYQNVTFKSRVFSQAESNLTTKFHLELIDELKSKEHEKFDQAETVASAIKLINHQNYNLDTVDLERERRICSTHHCKRTLAQLFNDYQEHLSEETIATVEASIAFLRVFDRVRQASGTTVNEIIDVLKRTRSDHGLQSSFLDILAAARTKDSILAALKYLRLPKNSDLDTAERFLSAMSVSAKTTAKMHLKRPIQSAYYPVPTNALKRGKDLREQQSHLASLEFIAQEFLRILDQTKAKKWASQKLRWSTLLTLATLVNANNQEHNFENIEDDFNKEVSNLLLTELDACPKSDADCRIVAIQAIGNVGYLSEYQFNALRDHVLHSGKRESISAMRVLRDLLQVQDKRRPLSQSMYTNLKDLLLRVVYDSTQDTTARVLAAEMIVRFIPSSLASIQLIQQLPAFGNNELATMIYSRMQSLRPDDIANHHENWYWKSCIINGTSTSFVKQLARTESLNASYGVNVELLNKGKILKESSFDVYLDTEKRTQDLLSLGIFVRGLSGWSLGGGGSDSDGGAEEDDESTMAGMSLRLLGGYLRPYVFFTGKGELISHIWAGTASEPTPAFQGDLLLIDHEEAYPLISGFVAEQQMRGVLSIDVSGKIKTSIWHRSSHSVVRTKASAIVHASQSVFTGYDNLWHSHLFSFGGQAMIDFVADLSFSETPFKICLQVTQPEFIVR